MNWTTDWTDGKPDAEPLPLWIKPERKLDVADMMDLMRDHFEGTPYDLSKNINTNPYKLPYHWHPME